MSSAMHYSEFTIMFWDEGGVAITFTCFIFVLHFLIVWSMGMIYKLFCNPLQTSPFSGFNLGIMYINWYQYFDIPIDSLVWLCKDGF